MGKLVTSHATNVKKLTKVSQKQEFATNVTFRGHNSHKNEMLGIFLADFFSGHSCDFQKAYGHFLQFTPLFTIKY